MSIHPNIASRKSTRAFDNRQVSKEMLTDLFEAVRWAPSAFNEQPWRFIIAQNGEQGFDLLCDCLFEGNRNWAKNGAFLFLVVAKTTVSHNNQPNRHALHDVGLAIGNLNFQATELGLYLHQMGGFDLKKAIDTFNIPEGFEPVTIIVGGYPGNVDLLDEQLKMREMAPRARKLPSEFVFSGHFGNTHPLFYS